MIKLHTPQPECKISNRQLLIELVHKNDLLMPRDLVKIMRRDYGRIVTRQYANKIKSDTVTGKVNQ